MKREFGYSEEEMKVIKNRGKGFTPSRMNGQFNRKTRRLIARGKLKVEYADNEEQDNKPHGSESKDKGSLWAKVKSLFF
jgi:hypothetical protein